MRNPSVKKIVLFSIFFCSLFVLYKSFFFSPSLHFSGERYQDVIINNRVVIQASGKRRDCETRYRLIRQVLDRYAHPFATLDIGANLGYYSFRIANDYDAVCVMIEGNNAYYPHIGDHLLKLCRLNQLDNIIYLNKVVTIEDLQRLSDCESFEVTLAMNIIHWFGPKWKEITDVILSLGDHAIIETPPQEPMASAEENERRRAIEEYLLQRGATILGQVPRHTSDTFSTLYFIEGSKTTLKRKTWIQPIEDFSSYQIQSNYHLRTFTKKTLDSDEKIVFPWTVGINLLTFKMYHGVYPEAKTLKNELCNLSKKRHNDWMVNNMILQGNSIRLIDKNDGRHHTKMERCSRKNLKAHLALIDLDTPEHCELYLLKYWGNVR